MHNHAKTCLHQRTRAHAHCALPPFCTTTTTCRVRTLAKARKLNGSRDCCCRNGKGIISAVASKPTPAAVAVKPTADANSPFTEALSKDQAQKPAN
eukprot:6192876-Pleurochrysis_carterae.AAC.1